jgi:hypothetical protein
MRRLLLVMSVALLALAGLVAGWGALLKALDPFDARPFDAAAWARAEHAEDRAPMARDLIRRHLRPGLPAKEVEALLGPPEPVPGVGGPVDGFGNRLRGERTYSYYLGCWSGIGGLDSAFLYVHLDGEGRPRRRGHGRVSDRGVVVELSKRRKP